MYIRLKKEKFDLYGQILIYYWFYINCRSVAMDSKPDIHESSGTTITMKEVIIDAIITFTITLFAFAILMIPFVLLGIINLWKLYTIYYGVYEVLNHRESHKINTKFEKLYLKVEMTELRCYLIITVIGMSKSIQNWNDLGGIADCRLIWRFGHSAFSLYSEGGA